MDRSGTGLSAQKRELLRLLVEDRQREELRRHDWDGPRPLSFAQQRLWFLDQWHPGTINYNIPALIRIQGALDVPLLQLAFQEILNRHEVLRAAFVSRDGECEQVLVPASRFTIRVEDVSSHSDPIAEARLRATDQFRKPFMLAEGPLLRATIYRAAPHDHHLALT